MVNESAYDLQDKWEILSQSLTAALDAMKAEFEVMKGEWALMKRAVANEGVPTHATHKIKTPEPFLFIS